MRTPMTPVTDFTAAESHLLGEPSQQTLINRFNALKKNYEINKQPSLSERKKLITSLKSALLQDKQNLISALNEDYGRRSEFDSVMADILPTIRHTNYTLKNLKSWLKPERRKAGFLLAPSSIYVHKQSLGVIGVIVPWNFPVFLSLGPIITALAAGNKVMVKLSEYTPKTNVVIRQLFSDLMADVAIVEGNARVASEFTQLPFDHVFFTGSTSIGRLVAQSCSERLIPTTLELGGKSPVVITQNSDLEKAADAIILGKSINAGQICVAPDYVLVHETQLEQFCEVYLSRFSDFYPEDTFDQEYGAIINTEQFNRLLAIIEDAKNLGADVLKSKNYEVNEEKRILPPHLLVNVTEQMLVTKTEIFGPILPVISYQTIHQATQYINDKERPLALYVMSQDNEATDFILAHTHSGGVCINDTLMHVGADDAPFGGIGESGLGNYHGREGFDTFCHKRTVLKTPMWLPRVNLILKFKTMAIKLLSKLFVR